MAFALIARGLNFWAEMGDTMCKTYMPTTDAGAVDWSSKFATLINATPNIYGLTSIQTSEFGILNGNLQTAWQKIVNPATKTKVTVADKNAALKAMKKAARYLVLVIQGQPTVTDGQKIELGLTVRRTEHSPIPVPTQKPFIRVMKVDGRTVKIRLQQDAVRRAKPAQVAGAAVFTYVGPLPPTSVDQWTFLSNTTRPTFDIIFAPGQAQIVWITAFWQNAKDESGPASAAISVSLPATGALPKTEKLKIAA